MPLRRASPLLSVVALGPPLSSPSPASTLAPAIGAPLPADTTVTSTDAPGASRITTGSDFSRSVCMTGPPTMSPARADSA